MLHHKLAQESIFLKPSLIGSIFSMVCLLANQQVLLREKIRGCKINPFMSFVPVTSYFTSDKNKSYLGFYVQFNKSVHRLLDCTGTKCDLRMISLIFYYALKLTFCNALQIDLTKRVCNLLCSMNRTFGNKKVMILCKFTMCSGKL